MRSASLFLCMMLALLCVDGVGAEGIEIKTGNIQIKTDTHRSYQGIRPYRRSPPYFERWRGLKNPQRYRLPVSRIEQSCQQRSGQVYQELRQVTTVDGKHSHTKVYSTQQC